MVLCPYLLGCDRDCRLDCSLKSRSKMIDCYSPLVTCTNATRCVKVTKVTWTFASFSAQNGSNNVRLSVSSLYHLQLLYNVRCSVMEMTRNTPPKLSVLSQFITIINDYHNYSLQSLVVSGSIREPEHILWVCEFMISIS